jgi:hypothetical protein
MQINSIPETFFKEFRKAIKQASQSRTGRLATFKETGELNKSSEIS